MAQIAKVEGVSSSKPMGRPKKSAKEINPQVQIGRHPESEIAIIDSAARIAGLDRSAWAWKKLLRAAKRELAVAKANDAKRGL